MNSAWHDVNALVELATRHAGTWGDSCHHALAQEVVRLRTELAARKKAHHETIAEHEKELRVAYRQGQEDQRAEHEGEGW